MLGNSQCPNCKTDHKTDCHDEDECVQYWSCGNCGCSWDIYFEVKVVDVKIRNQGKKQND